VTDFESVDFFTDESLVPNPYPYFDYLRSKCPVVAATPFGVLAVTGYEEALAVYKDPAFSSCVSFAGPFSGLPFGPGGDDVTELIEQHRDQLPMAEHIASQDPPEHTRTRGLLSKLLTPKRLRENEDFMWRFADQQLDTFIDRGQCEFLEDYAKPFSLLVIADLLGVPADDHDEFRAAFANQLAGALGDEEISSHNPLEFLNQKFYAYIEERRRAPRADVLTELAQAKYPDGSTPEIIDVMNLSTFLFAAGTETTTKLVSTAVRIIADNPGVETTLRDDRTLIPGFLEETLRLESPVKAHFRIARTSTYIGEVPVQAGTIVMLLPGACNRDARRFDDPHAFRPERPNVRETPRIYPWQPFMPGSTAGPHRGADLAESHLGPDVRTSDFRSTTRPSRCTVLPVRADVHPARTARAACSIHALKGVCSGRRAQICHLMVQTRLVRRSTRSWIHGMGQSPIEHPEAARREAADKAPDGPC
jgi:cytochrome P450